MLERFPVKKIIANGGTLSTFGDYFNFLLTFSNPSLRIPKLSTLYLICTSSLASKIQKEAGDAGKKGRVREMQ